MDIFFKSMWTIDINNININAMISYIAYLLLIYTAYILLVCLPIMEHLLTKNTVGILHVKPLKGCNNLQ